MHTLVDGHFFLPPRNPMVEEVSVLNEQGEFAIYVLEGISRERYQGSDKRLRRQYVGVGLTVILSFENR